MPSTTSICFVLLLILSLTSVVSAQWPAARCSTTNLNVRSGPSTGYGVMGSLQPGETVAVLEKTGDGWAKVGDSRWVSAQYLGNCPAATQCVGSDAVNVRTGPSTGYGISRTAQPGEQVTTYGSRVNGFFCVGDARWMHGDYLRSCGGGGGGGGGGGSTGDMSVSTLRQIIPTLGESRASQLIGHLNSALREGGITTCARKSAFIAQVAHESGGLNWFEEFASGDAYEGRKDLCNTQAGDGRRFKGRGPIQLTGRCNYTAAGRDLGLDLVGNPFQVATFSVGFRTTVWFWKSRNLNSYADQNTQSSFDSITLRINGGYNGKAERDQYWRRAKSVLGC